MVICKGGVEILSLVVVYDAEVLIFINYCVRAQPAGFEHQWLLMCDTQQSHCPQVQFSGASFSKHSNTSFSVSHTSKRVNKMCELLFLGELLKFGLLS